MKLPKIKRMHTKILAPTKENIRLAAECIRKGAAVGMPTETVYGLAADACNPAAVDGIFCAKGRPQDNPLIVHIACEEELLRIAKGITPQVHLLAKAFWPGPLTLVLPKGDFVAQNVCAGLSSVAVRLPAHPVARALIKEAGTPLAAPSANLSGSPSPTTAQHVAQDLSGRIPLVLDGGACLVGIESTVLSVVEKPVILRPGFVTKEELEGVLGQSVPYAASVEAPLSHEDAPQSPGMKYKHYAPKANITILDAKDDAYVQYIAEYMKGHFTQDDSSDAPLALCFEETAPLLKQQGINFVSYGSQEDNRQQAANIFFALRQLDELNAKTVFAQAPKGQGVGIAVRNRLLRAASFRVVCL